VGRIPRRMPTPSAMARRRRGGAPEDIVNDNAGILLCPGDEHGLAVALSTRLRELHRPESLGPALAVALIGFYVLLPLDRGFPPIPLFGRPVNSAVVATLAVFLLLALQSRGRVLSYLREPYCIVQSAYFGVLVASAVRTASPPSALHWSLVYYCTFVLNYAIIRQVTRQRGIRWLSVWVARIGVVGAVIGITQSLTGFTLPIYETWFVNYFSSPLSDYTSATVRAVGTLNNPILYCLAMVLVVPYALDLKQTRSRLLVLSLVLFAAGLSGSRTALLIVAVFASGAVAVYRWRALWVLPFASVGMALMVQSLGGLGAAAQDDRVVYMLERAGLVQASEVALSAAQSLEYRRFALAEGIRESWLFT
jgi:hypothetical protein